MLTILNYFKPQVKVKAKDNFVVKTPKNYIFSQHGKLKCKDCKYYIVKSKSINPFFNECSRFGYINEKTNLAVNQLAEDSRKNLELCGINGYYFDPSDEYLNSYFEDF